MFQYAALSYLSLQKEFKLYFDRVDRLRYFENVEISLRRKIGYKATLIRAFYNKSLFVYSEPNQSLTTNNQMRIIDEMLALPYPKLVSGFFQSAAFFNNDLQYAKELFKIKKEYFVDFRNRFGEYLCIHIRAGDYKDFGSEILGYDLRLPNSYFLDALKRANDYDKVLVVTDDESRARKILGSIGCEFVSGSEIEDFQLLMQADQIIISNSSFSWWAAYLSDATKVLAPNYWLGFKKEFTYPPHIYEGLEWERIDIAL